MTKFNIYWNEGEASYDGKNLSLRVALIWAEMILESGGEITGIINAEDD